MARASLFSAYTYDSSAAWQTTLTAFHNMLTSAGFVQTADTGQLDPATATYVGISTTLGYMIYRTNDGFDPVYFKITFRQGNTAGRPGWDISIGRGTNGAGALINVVLSPVGDGNWDMSFASTNSRACTGPGYAWFHFLEGVRTSSSGMPRGLCNLAILRFADVDGNPTNDGFVVYTSVGGGVNAVQYRAAGAAVSPNGQRYCLIPGDGAQAALGGGDLQFWRHFTGQPRMTINPFAYTCDVNAVPTGTEIAMPLPAGGTINMISTGLGFGYNAGAGGADTRHVYMLPWVA